MTKNREDETSPLSFLNTEFLKSPAARAIRILSEYLEPAERLRRARIRDTIVFFGSARSPSPEQAAQRLAQVNEEIAQAGAVSAGLAQAPNAPDAPRRRGRPHPESGEPCRPV